MTALLGPRRRVLRIRSVKTVRPLRVVRDRARVALLATTLTLLHAAPDDRLACHDLTASAVAATSKSVGRFLTHGRRATSLEHTARRFAPTNRQASILVEDSWRNVMQVRSPAAPTARRWAKRPLVHPRIALSCRAVPRRSATRQSAPTV
jgi:hypothetical protein